MSAAVLWIAAGAGYFILEAIAAAHFRQPYSYAQNYISDLGVASRSPLAYLMNTAFYLQGTLFLLGAVLMVRAVGSRKAEMFLAWAAMNAVGNILVGTVQSGVWVHVVGAALAIVGGNMAIIAGSAIVRDSGAAHWYRVASVGLAVIGLLCFALIALDSVTPAIGVLAVGALERGSVYSIIAWQMVTGVFLVRSASHTVSGA